MTIVSAYIVFKGTDSCTIIPRHAVASYLMGMSNFLFGKFQKDICGTSVTLEKDEILLLPSLHVRILKRTYIFIITLLSAF